MADEEKLAEGQQDDLEEQFAAADEQADPSKDHEPLPVEEIAARMGWVPKEKFRGDDDKWKPADQFIIDGKDIQDRQSRELKTIRDTLDTIKATNASILTEKLTQQHEQLAARYQAAVEKGDPDEAFAVGNEIMRVKAAATPPRPAPAPETNAWVGKNQRLMNDPLAAQRAVQVCDAYARAGQSVDEQLANTEAVMRREFPHHFDSKAPAQVNGVTSRASTTITSKGKTGADLPKEAKAVAEDLVERGQIPNLDAYAKHYFANTAKG